MHVHVRDALADAVVDRDEGALCAKGVLDRDGKPARVGKHLGHQVGRQVAHGLVMLARYHEHVTGEQRAVVEEGERALALERGLAPSPELGVITACFAAAWPADGNPPPDEGMEGRSVRATGRTLSTTCPDTGRDDGARV